MIQPVVELNLKQWRHHVTAAEKFPGTLTRYCREQGLVMHRFLYYRKKFSSQPVFKHKFIRIETQSGLKGPNADNLTLSKDKASALPDPEWLAKFLLKLCR